MSRSTPSWEIRSFCSAGTVVSAVNWVAEFAERPAVAALVRLRVAHGEKPNALVDVR